MIKMKPPSLMTTFETDIISPKPPLVVWLQPTKLLLSYVKLRCGFRFLLRLSHVPTHSRCLSFVLVVMQAFATINGGNHPLVTYEPVEFDKETVPSSRLHVKVNLVQDDPKILVDGREIPKSQGRGWWLDSQSWYLLPTWHKTSQVVNYLFVLWRWPDILLSQEEEDDFRLSNYGFKKNVEYTSNQWTKSKHDHKM